MMNSHILRLVEKAIEYARVTKGILAWCRDHGADPHALRGIEDLRHDLLRAAATVNRERTSSGRR